MSELISREALKAIVERHMDMQDLYLPAHFLDLADDLPTVDAVEVVHGHWVKPGGYVCGDYEFVCSVCGDCRWEGLGLPNRAHYCQCCGAKMDEVSE